MDLPHAQWIETKARSMTIPKTASERYAFGQSQRKHMRRADHAGWQPKTRTADPAQLLAASIQGRVKELLPIKYDRMAASPFGYFRGAVPVMASDLSVGPNTGIFTQLCGDAHIRNLGAFAAPDGRLVFDLNDFDETIRGPFEWDVKRMATSIILAGREANAKNSQCREAAHAFLAHYRSSMHAFARMPVLMLARYMVHRLRTVRPISEILALAERGTPLHNLDVLTVPAASLPAAKKVAATSELPRQTHGHARIFRTIEPLLTRVSGATARSVLDSLTTYAETLQPERQHFLAQYTPIDVAFKIVGTGSVGLRDYCIYLQGNGAKDPLFLQIKEEAASGYAPYLGQAPTPVHQGRRVVEGQRAMQFQSDPFLGWTTIEGRDYLVRQLNDYKGSVNLQTLRAASLLEYAAVCGETLARGHARASDPASIAGYIGNSDSFDDAIVRFAAEYADQTDRDWEALVHSRGGKTATAPAARKAAKKHARKHHAGKKHHAKKKHSAKKNSKVEGKVSARQKRSTKQLAAKKPKRSDSQKA
jgi:uncharacterized protein (DUF2252 family)